jgi:hypothetical protein
MKLKALSEIGFVWHKMPSAIPMGHRNRIERSGPTPK